MKNQNKNAVDKYFIIDLNTMDYFKDNENKINLFDTEEQACITCGIYELENVLVCRGVFNHIEGED